MTEPVGDAGVDVARFVASRLRNVPDFPEPGIRPIDLVAGIEARGFIVAAALSRELGCGMLPIRKAGKLPPPTLRRAYSLEYGTAEIEVPAGVLSGRRVFLVDDVLATGGTLAAAAGLLADAGAEVAAVATLLELGFLDGRSRVTGMPVYTLLKL